MSAGQIRCKRPVKSNANEWSNSCNHAGLITQEDVMPGRIRPYDSSTTLLSHFALQRPLPANDPTQISLTGQGYSQLSQYKPAQFLSMPASHPNATADAEGLPHRWLSVWPGARPYRSKPRKYPPTRGRRYGLLDSKAPATNRLGRRPNSMYLFLYLLGVAGGGLQWKAPSTS